MENTKVRPKGIPMISILMILFGIYMTRFAWFSLLQLIRIVPTALTLPGRFELPFPNTTPLINLLIFGIPPIAASIGLWKMTKWGYGLTIFVAIVWIVGALYLAVRVVLGYEDLTPSIIVVALNFIFTIVVIFYTWQNREYFI